MVAIPVIRTHGVSTLLGATSVSAVKDLVEMDSHAQLSKSSPNNWSVVLDTSPGVRDAWVS